MSVLATVDAFTEEIEFDLLRLGLRLRNVGTDAFTWRDLYVVIRQSGQDSALFRAINEDDHFWGLAEMLLAEIADGVAVGNWQRGNGKRRDYPKPIPRPGVEPDSTTYGGKKPLPIDEMADWLGWT